ncbi:MAG: cryptochrome/photolyase family protein, partial [Candidatus Promineifilaceae bacterium]
WRLMPDLLGQNYWGAERSLPDFFWDGTTEMNCLQRVISRAISTGYNHHIERLMVLCNFCLLAGIDPQEVNEWFLTLYIDAYDWVMAPNVVGMGLNADGGKIATKPYIASSNYINKMSDYCGACSFDQRKRHGPGACPFNYLYWNFLIGHEKLLRSNPRMGRNVLSLRHLDRNERIAVQQEAARFFDSIWGVG